MGNLFQVQATGIARYLRIIELVLKEPLIELSRTWTTADVFLMSSQSFTFDNIRSILPGQKRKGWATVVRSPLFFFLDKSNLAYDLDIKVPKAEKRLERHRFHISWSSLWSFLTNNFLVMVFYQVQSQSSCQESLEHFLLLSTDAFCFVKMLIYCLSVLGTSPFCLKKTQKNCYCA